MRNFRGNAVGNLVGNSAANAVGNPAANAVGNLVENIADNSVGQGEGEKVYLRKAVIGGNFSIWNE